MANWKEFNRSNQPDLYQRVLLANRHGQVIIGYRTTTYDDLLGQHDFWSVELCRVRPFTDGILHRDAVLAFAELPKFQRGG